MEFKIKQVSVEEINLWLKWRMEVLDHVFPEMTSSEREFLTKANYDYFLKSVPDKNHVATFAILDNKIIGTGDLCIYSEMPSPDNHNGKCGYLMNIYVREKFRDHGYASSIVTNLINIAQNLEITKIYLETTKAAQNLYKQLGFSEMKGYLVFKNGK